MPLFDNNKNESFLSNSAGPHFKGYKGKHATTTALSQDNNTYKNPNSANWCVFNSTLFYILTCEQ